ncbi:PfkB family carbohydrate kinase [Streptomyces sp. NPDC097619]|uniref:PfkB family carbohydrate kinase n=1 Tax=Streptomyces sp. NPDC097619 TaxID=3157228 RepID=UPI00331D9D66
MEFPTVPRLRGPDVLTFGETVVALSAAEPLRPGGPLVLSVTGPESSVALALAGRGHRVRWAGAVGEDPAGRLVLDALAARGVDVSGAQRDPGARTGLLLTGPDAGPLPGPAVSAAARIRSCEVQRVFAEAPPRLLYLTDASAPSREARSAAQLALRMAAEHSALVCLDLRNVSATGTGPLPGSVDVWLPSADLVILAEERPATTRTAPRTAPAGAVPPRVRDLLGRGPGEVLVRWADGGASAYRLGGEGEDEGRGEGLHAAPAPAALPRTPAVPGLPVTAADAFAAAYLSGLLSGADSRRRLDRAVAAARAGTDPHTGPDAPGSPERVESDGPRRYVPEGAFPGVGACA